MGIALMLALGCGGAGPDQSPDQSQGNTVPGNTAPGNTAPGNTAPTREAVHLLAGTYTDGESRGIYRLTYDPATHSFDEPSLLAEVSNPSYGTASRDQEKFYFVVEDSAGKLQAFGRGPAGEGLAPLESDSTRGQHPCYLAMSPDERHLAVANYSSGNVAVFTLEADGRPRAEPRVLQHRGVGENPERQEGPHAHWAEWNPEGTFLYVVDLGLDQVMAYPFDRSAGELGDGFVALETTAGAGPRHMVFHPRQNLVYLFNELSNEVVVAARETDGTLEQLQTLVSLPPGFAEASYGAHIAIDTSGSRLYVSNRGHDSIAVFEIAADGRLTVLQHISTGGHWPRFFLLLAEEGLLLVANQRSDNVVAFEIDAQGTLTRVGEPAGISQPTYLGILRDWP